MFRRVQDVLVAVSGGPDSLACLHVLLRLADEFGFRVTVAHFDHQLRPDSRDDLEFVRGLAAELGLECITGEGDVASVARTNRQGIEETARAMRYQFLAFAAEREGADCVATGHTRDDQVETVLMHIVRGSGVRGARGMLPVSGLPGTPERRLIRPLLATSRAETEAVCDSLQLTPRRDATNTDTGRTRNRIRVETLASLQALNPSVDKALLGLAESARQAYDLLERRSFEAQPAGRGPIGAIFATAAVAGLPAESLALAIEREAAFYHLQPSVNRERLQTLVGTLSRGHGQVAFGDTTVEVSCGQVRVGPPLEEVEPFPAAVLNIPGSTRAGPWRVDVRTDAMDATPESPVIAISDDGRAGALRARPLVPGERMLFRGARRKISDLLVDARVPVWERAGMVAISDSEHVLGIFGATQTLVADVAGAPGLWVRLTALPRG